MCACTTRSLASLALPEMNTQTKSDHDKKSEHTWLQARRTKYIYEIYENWPTLAIGGHWTNYATRRNAPADE